jgi:hypothetical protein
MEKEVFFQTLPFLIKIKTLGSSPSSDISATQDQPPNLDQLLDLSTKELLVNGYCLFATSDTNKVIACWDKNPKNRTQSKFKLELVRTKVGYFCLLVTLEEKFEYILDHSQVTRLSIYPAIEDAKKVKETALEALKPPYIRFSFPSAALQIYKPFSIPKNIDKEIVFNKWQEQYEELFKALQTMLQSLNGNKMSSQFDISVLDDPTARIKTQRISWLSFMASLPILNDASPLFTSSDNDKEIDESLSDQLNKTANFFNQAHISADSTKYLSKATEHHMKAVEKQIDASVDEIYASFEPKKENNNNHSESKSDSSLNHTEMVKNLQALQQQYTEQFEANLMLKLLPTK